MKKKLLMALTCIAVLSLSIGVMTGCGEKKVSMKNQAICSTIADYEYGGTVLGTDETTYLLHLMDDGSYSMTVTTLTNMGGMVLGSTGYVSYGTYERGGVTDGKEAISLSVPTRVVYSSQSSMGGYAFDYDTDVDTEFIIPGGDDTAMSKAAFIEGIGFGETKTVYIIQNSVGAATCQMTFDAE